VLRLVLLLVNSPRGVCRGHLHRGLFMALELVEDRASKAPFDHNKKLHAVVKAQAFDNGLLVYPMGGTIDGERGDHVLLAPPFITSEGDLDRIVELLALSIDQSINSCAR
jgi:adenosylmethionine-8-amino-7-oxononanoate aminotransferase